MTDQISSLLTRYADEMSAGHLAPPAPVAPAPRIWRGRAARRWLPALAAAGAVGVVGVAALLQASAGTDRAADLSVAATPEPPRESDTPPPPYVLLEMPPDMPGNQAVTAPPGRERLDVGLELPEAPVVDEPTAYTVIISNPGPEPVALRPCPAFRVEYGGQGSTGRLPCEQLPDELSAGQTLRVTLQAVFGMWDGPDDPPSRDIDVAWAIAGPPAARGRTVLTWPPLPAPIASAPYVEAPAPAGEPVGGPEGLQKGLRPEWRLTPTIVEFPSTVRAGQTLRYTVRLFNVDPKEAVPLEPCRGFTQWLQRPVQPAGEQVAFLDWSFERGEIASLHSEEHMLNCDALPKEIPSRQWVSLAMELDVPVDYEPGPTSLAWKVGELDVFGSMQSRYVTVDVLPAR